jgi:hypothetical protein
MVICATINDVVLVGTYLAHPSVAFPKVCCYPFAILPSIAMEKQARDSNRKEVHSLKIIERV